MEWDKLTFRERAEYIKTGVKNGLTNIDDIKGAYNKFDKGGHIYDGKTEDTQQMDIPYSSQAVLNAALANPNGGIFIGDKSIPHEDREYIYNLPEVPIIGKDYSKPYESAYHDDLKTLLLHGIPEAGSWLMGNTVGRIVDAVPGASEGLSLITPSRWAGTIGGGLNGEWVAPWSTNNQGWSSLVGEEYGEALDFYGDLYLGSKVPKALKYTGKGALKGVEKATNGRLYDSYTTLEGRFGMPVKEWLSRRIGFNNTARIPDFIRKLNLEVKLNDGKVDLTGNKVSLKQARDGFNPYGHSNFTLEEGVRNHYEKAKKGWDKSPYMYVVNGEHFLSEIPLETLKSIEPSDAFVSGAETVFDPSKVTLITGDVEALTRAKELGMETSSSPALRKMYKKYLENEDSPLGKPDYLDVNYSQELNNVLHRRGHVTMKDIKALEEKTGLSSGVASITELDKAIEYLKQQLTTLNLDENGEAITYKYPNGRKTDIAPDKTSRELRLINRHPYTNIFYDPATHFESEWRTGKNFEKEYYELHPEEKVSSGI